LVETKRTKVGKDLTSDHKDGGKHDVAAALWKIFLRKKVFFFNIQSLSSVVEICFCSCWWVHKTAMCLKIVYCVVYSYCSIIGACFMECNYLALCMFIPGRLSDVSLVHANIAQLWFSCSSCVVSTLNLWPNSTKATRNSSLTARTRTRKVGTHDTSCNYTFFVVLSQLEFWMAGMSMSHGPSRSQW
jgi:hypothetical protein